MKSLKLTISCFKSPCSSNLLCHPGKQLTLNSTLKNASNLSPTWTTVAPKPYRVSCLQDLPVVSTKPFEAFYDASFDLPPETKSIEAYRNALQNLEIALQQIDNSDKIVHCALDLEKSRDGNISSPDISFQDTASISKLI